MKNYKKSVSVASHCAVSGSFGAFLKDYSFKSYVSNLNSGINFDLKIT